MSLLFVLVVPPVIFASPVHAVTNHGDLRRSVPRQCSICHGSESSPSRHNLHPKSDDRDPEQAIRRCRVHQNNGRRFARRESEGTFWLLPREDRRGPATRGKDACPLHRWGQSVGYDLHCLHDETSRDDAAPSVPAREAETTHHSSQCGVLSAAYRLWKMAARGDDGGDSQLATRTDSRCVWGADSMPGVYMTPPRREGFTSVLYRINCWHLVHVVTFVDKNLEMCLKPNLHFIIDLL